MLNEVKTAIKTLKEQVEKKTPASELSAKASEIAQEIKLFEEQNKPSADDFNGLVKFAVDIYSAIGWDLYKLHYACTRDAELNTALADLMQFYSRLNSFLQVVFNEAVITPKLIKTTQELLKVDPSYLPKALPDYLSEPKIGETPEAFAKRRMAEHIQARATNQTKELSSIRQNELQYKSAIKFVNDEKQKAYNPKNPKLKEYVDKHIKSEHKKTYDFIENYKENITWKSKTPEQEVLSISLRQFADRVEYYNDAERARYRKFISDGKFYERASETQDLFAFKPTDTTEKTSKGVANYAAFVISSHGEIYAETHLSHDFDGKKADTFRFHSSFTSGSFVMTAGEIKTGPTGQLLAITNRSGHYFPNLYDLYKGYRFMKDKGLDFSNCTFEYVQYDANGKEKVNRFNEKEFLEYFNACSQKLYNAILNKDINTMRGLLKDGAVLSQKQYEELKPHIQIYLDEQLRLAFNDGNSKEVDHLMHQGAQFRFDQKDIVVLYAASIKANHAGLLEVLKKRHYDLHYQDQHGNNALHIAVRNNNLPVIDFLIKNGLNPHKTNLKNESAADLALELGVQYNFDAVNPAVVQASETIDVPPPAEVAAVDVPPAPVPEPIEKFNINIEGEDPFDQKYLDLLHEAIIVLTAQASLQSKGFLPDFLNAAIMILDGAKPAVLPVRNKELQKEYANFIDIMSQIQAYTKSESIHPSFIDFRKHVELEHQRFAALNEIRNPVIQALLMPFGFSELVNKQTSDDINKLIMASTSVEKLRDVLDEYGFNITKTNSHYLNNIFAEAQRNQALEIINNKTLRKILTNSDIYINAETAKSINDNEALNSPDLKRSACNAILVKLLGANSFFINEAQFKEMLRETKTEYAKKLEFSATDIKADFLRNSADIAQARQDFKQQRRPNVFKSKRYNLEKLNEMAELLTRKMFIFTDYHNTVEKLKLIQSSDFELPDITTAIIRQHGKDLQALEMQVNAIIKLTVDEMTRRTVKLFDLAKTLQQRIEKNQKADKLVNDWEQQKPFIEKLLAMHDQLNALPQYYKFDEKTETKLIHRLNELMGAKETISSLVEQAVENQKAQEENSVIQLTSAIFVPVIEVEKPANKVEPIKPARIQPITFPNEIVPVAGTDGLTYQKKDGATIYKRPETLETAPASRSKGYTEKEKLVFAQMARDHLATLEEQLKAREKDPTAEKISIELVGSQSMGNKIAIWLTAIQNANKTFEKVDIVINGKPFKPTLLELAEIKQKQRAEPKPAPQQRRESRFSEKLELANTDEHTPILRHHQMKN